MDELSLLRSSNAQAKTVFPHSHLVVGIHPACALKGATVYSVEEKEKLLKSCHFVDDIVLNVPYGEITPALLDEVKCDVACHGQDPVVLASGIGMYDAAKSANRFVELRRSEGISTTILIHRILHPDLPTKTFPVDAQALNTFRRNTLRLPAAAPLEKPARVVFLAGRFDLLHFTHVAVLEEAKTHGDFLLVGITNGNQPDTRPPVQTVGERALTLLSMKVVDDAIWDYTFDDEFCRRFSITTVVHVQHEDFDMPPPAEGVAIVELPPPRVSRSDIIDRIIKSPYQFEERNERRLSGKTVDDMI
eukprot:GEMP01030194.1.p1 GENE.GEMP01030194.1~~GEMP01030194.1.p1  ORF type:complete len:304 (+),score=61.42 GEMP01030194.1:224-1135(+)